MKSRKTTPSDDSNSELAPFTRFKNLLRGLVNVPKKEIEAEDARCAKLDG